MTRRPSTVETPDAKAKAKPIQKQTGKKSTKTLHIFQKGIAAH